MEEGKRRKTELLAPAGSFVILKAVEHAGADAVYCAGDKFGARAYANNFHKEEMISAIDFMHLREKKLYLTVNTLLKEKELETELYKYLLPFYEAGLDAVIVQDLGVMHFIRTQFPELPIHASTQMTITGAYGAELMQANGCSRIVTARELSLEEIKDIYDKTGVEIESFIHGALCYSYSGQCLMSSMIGGRSGNRGRCAQPCRLPYEWYGDKKAPSYLLSLKDLCTIDLIPEMIAHGIHSFKIEGRMKQAEYAAGVTSIYRKYIDRYETDPSKPYQVEEADRKKLLELGNRCGFTDGYYQRHNGKEMITFSTPSHEKGKNEYTETESKEKIKGILILSKDIPAKLVLEYKKMRVEVTGNVVQPSQKQPLSQETVLEKMKKTGNTPFLFEELEIQIQPDIFIPVGALNQLRRKGLEQLKEAIILPYRRSMHQKSLETTNIQKDAAKPKLLEQLRVLVETREQLFVVLKEKEVERVYLELSMFDDGLEAAEVIKTVKKSGKEAYLALPYILRKPMVQWLIKALVPIQKAEPEGYLVRNLEEIGFLKEQDITEASIQVDYNVYVYSKEAERMLNSFGIWHTTLPVEYNHKEILYLNCNHGELIIYGHQPLMVSAQCVRKNAKGCDRKSKVSYLKDRYGKLFPVKNNCRECYNVIYNVNPLALFHHWETIHKLRPEGIRLSFTKESGKETAQVFEQYRTVFKGEKKPQNETYIPDFTNGHFKRGVE